jgi:hypothetical protein
VLSRKSDSGRLGIREETTASLSELDLGGDRITCGIMGSRIIDMEYRHVSGIESVSLDALEITSEHLEERHVIIALWVEDMIQCLQ